MNLQESRPHRSLALPYGSSGSRLWLATIGFFALALVLFGALYSQSPLLYDGDSYYHLTVARAQLEGGLGHDFPWVRFGPLARDFGDKEVFFHLFLTPFLAFFGPLLGGKIALCVLDALLFATLGHLALRAWGRRLGTWGLLIPLWIVVGSTEVAWRIVRLRPEILSILLLVLALWAAGSRRYRLVGVLSAVYALSYVAIHAFVGVFLLLFLVEAWIEKRAPWPLLGYLFLGSGIGLIVHPDFPANLAVIWFVAVEFFRFKAVTDVGTEIRSNLTEVTLLANLGWWLGLAALWRCTTREPEEDDQRINGLAGEYDRLARAFGVGAFCFVVLYLLMSRFSLYAFPLVSLWFVLEQCRSGRVPTRWVRLPGRGRLPMVAAVAVCCLAALWIGRQEVGRYLHRTDAGPGEARLQQSRAFSAVLPESANVAAPWGATARYMFWAPQGRYLNVLDPGFLAWGDPEAHVLQRELFAGREPDPTLAAKAGLDSDFVAFPVATTNPRLTSRLANDPRVVVLHRASDALYGIRSVPPETFVLDWLAERKADLAAQSHYPRFPAPRQRGYEGYVDLARLGAVAGCYRLTYSGTDRLGGRFEFSPLGPSSLWAGDRLLAELPSGTEAVLGEGVLVDVSSEDWSGLRVETCSAAERAGFYLVRREGNLPAEPTAAG